MFGYGFFYTDSRLEETLMDLPQVDLYEFHLQLIQISNNNPKTKKKIKKIKNLYPKYTIIRFVTIKKFQID